MAMRVGFSSENDVSVLSNRPQLRDKDEDSATNSLLPFFLSQWIKMTVIMRHVRPAAARPSAAIGSCRRTIAGRTSRRTVLVRAAEPEFDEGAAQVRRLLDRDRKDMDFEALESAFGDDAPPSGTPDKTSPPPAGTPAGSAAPASPAVSMSSKPTMSPFGSAGTPLPFEPKATKPSIEPRGLSPDMKPDVIASSPWWTKITLTQVVIVLSFTTIIGLMIATFFVVLNMGAIRLNE